MLSMFVTASDCELELPYLFSSELEFPMACNLSRTSFYPKCWDSGSVVVIDTFCSILDSKVYWWSSVVFDSLLLSKMLQKVSWVGAGSTESKSSSQSSSLTWGTMLEIFLTGDSRSLLPVRSLIPVYPNTNTGLQSYSFLSVGRTLKEFTSNCFENSLKSRLSFRPTL